MTEDPHPLAVALQQVYGKRLGNKGMIVCNVAGESADRHIQTTLTLTMPGDDRDPIVAQVVLGVTHEG